jgi:hypothetical protein
VPEPVAAQPREPAPPAGTSPAVTAANPPDQRIWPTPAEGAGQGRAAAAWDAAGGSARAPPAALGAPPDLAAVTGPPWPRLVAAPGTYTPPRLIRWPIVVGIVLLAGWTVAVAVAVAGRAATAPVSPAAASSPHPAGAGYVLTADDAHFTATFPGKPQRTTQAAGPITVIVYMMQTGSHAVAVTYLPLSASAPVSLNGGINGAAASLPAGRVVSRHMLTYHGQPAEDAVISSSAGSARMRVVRFGTSAYVLEGFGNTPASFAHDYQVLLATFTPDHP